MRHLAAILPLLLLVALFAFVAFVSIYPPVLGPLYTPVPAPLVPTP